MKRVIYIVLGVFFGMAMYKAEAASWFRIYEMFNFQSFHMYGFMATALLIGVIGTQWIKKSDAKDINGKKIVIQPKSNSIKRYLYGGVFFGMGWALVGACPGPIFALIGAGVLPMILVAVFALLGTYLYGILRDKLPH